MKLRPENVTNWQKNKNENKKTRISRKWIDQNTKNKWKIIKIERENRKKTDKNDEKNRKNGVNVVNSSETNMQAGLYVRPLV